MSVLYTYVCTRSTVDPYIPPQAIDLPHLARDVSDGFYALSGGHFTVGQLAFFPIQRSVANHLLCDGREVPKVSFPELYDYLQDSQGTPADPDNFVLPDFLTTIAAATTSTTETTTAGTVSTPPPSPPPPGPQPTTKIWGDVDSGGRMSGTNIP